MSRIITLSSVMAMAMSTPMLLANTAPALRALPAHLGAAQMEGNCDLMASNTVSAGFLGLRDLTVQTVDQDAPTTVQVAVFQVIDTLGYRRFNHFGDGRLLPGTQFTISMDRELPGQPTANVDLISTLAPGDEVIMRVDHLYLRAKQEGQSIRACARLARRHEQLFQQAPATGADSTQEPAPLPIPGSMQQLGGVSQSSFQMSSRSFSMTTDASGQMQTVQTSRIYDPASGQIKTRMLINGVEVDPETRQPLAPAAAPQSAAPAPAPVAQPVPAAQPQPAAPEAPAAETAPAGTPQAAPAAPAAPAAQETPEGHLPASESF